MEWVLGKSQRAGNSGHWRKKILLSRHRDMKHDAKCIWLNKKWVRSHGNHWCYFWNLLTSRRVPMSCHAIFDLIGQDLVNHKVVSSNPNTPNVIREHRDCWANEVLSRSPFFTPVPFCIDHVSWHQFPFPLFLVALAISWFDVGICPYLFFSGRIAELNQLRLVTCFLCASPVPYY